MTASAKNANNVPYIKDKLLEISGFAGMTEVDTVITHLRHLEALKKCLESLDAARETLESGMPSDMVAIDLRRAMHELGAITGEITTEDLLGNIIWQVLYWEMSC